MIIGFGAPLHMSRTDKYPAIVTALRTVPARQAYLDGELCGVRPDGITSFALIQNAADRRGGADLIFFVFDLLYLDGLESDAAAVGGPQRCAWPSSSREESRRDPL